MEKLNHLFAFILIILLSCSTSVFSAPLEKENIKTSSANLKQPKQSFYSSSIERLGDGFADIVYGPLELIYQMKEEIKRTDPVHGFVPGLLRGVSWFGAREVVGAFEIVTFFLPLKPHIEPFNTDWFHA